MYGHPFHPVFHPALLHYERNAPRIDLPEAIERDPRVGREMQMMAHMMQQMAAAVGYGVELHFTRVADVKPRLAMPVRPIVVSADGVTCRCLPIIDSHDPILAGVSLGRLLNDPFQRRQDETIPYRGFVLVGLDGTRRAAMLYRVNASNRHAARLKLESDRTLPPATLGRLLQRMEESLGLCITEGRDEAYMAENAHLVRTEVVDDMAIVHTAAGWDIRVSAGSSRRVFATRTGDGGALEFTQVGTLMPGDCFRLDPVPPHLPGLSTAICSAFNAGILGDAHPRAGAWTFLHLDGDHRAVDWTDQILTTLETPGEATRHLLRDGISVATITRDTVRRRTPDILANIDGPYAVLAWAYDGYPSGSVRDEKAEFLALNQMRRQAGFDTEWNGQRWVKPKKGAPAKAGKRDKVS